jgi:hypothetical protein
MLSLGVSLVVVGMIVVVLYRAQKSHLVSTYMTPTMTPAHLGCRFDQDKVKAGLEYFKDKKLIITGLVRDSKDNIPTMQLNIGKLTRLFKDYAVLLVENDSADGTRQALLAWGKKDPKITVLGCGLNADKCELNLPPTVGHPHITSRIRKMVLLRNIYMDYIEAEGERFHDYDFLVAIDLDIFGTFYVDGIGSAGHHFLSDSNVQGLCANGVSLVNVGVGVIKRYHDGFAHKELDGRDAPLVRIGPLWTIQCSDEPWKIKSCFNGFTIYRLSSIMGKHYVLAEENGHAVCEHVTFNEQIDGIYIAPYLIFTIINNTGHP